MKKQLLSLVLILVLLMGVTAQATGPDKSPSAKPNLVFQGTTAVCTALVRGNTASDKIAVTAKLWSGSTCLKAWYKSGISVVSLKETTTVTKGKTYKLTIDYTVNGVPRLQRSVTGTCT